MNKKRKRRENSILVPILFIFSSCFNSTFIPHHFYKMHTVVYYFTRCYCYTMLVLFMNIFCYFILHVSRLLRFFSLPSSHLISCCFHVAFALALAAAAADASVTATVLHFCYCFCKLRLIFVCVNVCVLF